MVKILPTNAGDVGSIPGLGRCPGELKATHSSILAWKIPWTEEPGRLQSWGHRRVWHDLAPKPPTTTHALRPNSNISPFRMTFTTLTTTTKAKAGSFSLGFLCFSFVFLSSQPHQLLTALLRQWASNQPLPQGVAVSIRWLNACRALLMMMGLQ